MSHSGAVITNDDNELTRTLSQLQILKKENTGCVFEGRPARNYSICGKIEEIQFEIALLVIEEDKVHPYIQSLDINFNGAWSSELKPLKWLICSLKEPTLALIGVRSYLNEIRYRYSIWKWMKEKWDNHVSIPSGRYSNFVIIIADNSIQPSNYPKCVLSWAIDFSQDGVVVPTILPFFDIAADDEKKHLGATQLLLKIRTLFLSILEMNGVKPAISFLMDCIM